VRPSPKPFKASKIVLGLASACLAALALLLFPAEARAQASYFYLDRAQLSGAPDDGFMVWRPHMSEETRFYGFAALGYAHNPLRDETVTADSDIENQISDPIRGQINGYAHIGMEVSRRLSLNIALPIMLYKFTSDDPLYAGVGEGGIDGNRAAIHDVRFDARVMVFESDSRKLRLGLGGALWAPTGNGGAFTSDDALSGYVFGAGELDFGKWFLTGNIGPQFREERSIGGPNGDLYTDSELRYAFGAYLPLRGGKIRPGVELWGTTGIAPVGPTEESTFFGSRNTTIEWLAQVRMLLDQRQRVWFMGGAGTRLFTGYGAADIRLLVSIGTFLTLKDFDSGSPPPKVTFAPDADLKDPDSDGDGYPDSIDACPHEKEDGKPPNPTDGCPGNADRDKDGIPDNVDQCPDKPEDKDGVQDEDGCPEDDADGDGIADAQDKCPTQAGRRWPNNPAKNGCPGLTQLDDQGNITLLKPIEFEFGKAVIKPVSYPILDEVVELMKGRPSARVGVYGHTDNVGSDATNTRLSRERATACKNYLVGKGIAAGRLDSKGFGPSQPVADNGTDEGRARNRRVDFKILND
jgi:outer membrane protein OmpA-like peptidoglycan-associated protein